MLLLLYVMNVTCYYIFYVFVCVLCNPFMLSQIVQTIPIKAFKISMYILLKKTQTINGTWHLSSLKARTKVSLIWLIRSQQLCRGTGHIRLIIKFYSEKNAL